jgi:hypothetical protein
MIRFVLRTLLAVTLASAAVSPAAAEDLGAQLCASLGKVVPSVRGYQPEGVRAQLVMEIAGAFDYEPEALRREREEIDAVTTKGCPALRTEAMKLAGTASLRDAIQ